MLRPSGNVTRRASIKCEPSLALYPSITMVPPIFRSVFFHPRLVRAPGPAPSAPQLVVFPFASVTSRYRYEWGLVHSTRVTLPTRRTGLLPPALSADARSEGQRPVASSAAVPFLRT